MKKGLSATALSGRLHNVLFCTLFCFFYSYGQTDSSNTIIIQDSIQTIAFYFPKSSKIFSLNQFTPLNDSCGSLEITFLKPMSIRAILNVNKYRVWSLTAFHYDARLGNGATITASVSNSDSNNLKNINIFCKHNADSSVNTLSLNGNDELPTIVPDSSITPLSYVISRASFLCPENPLAIIENRVFTYPAWYMKREPVLNYPELSMFHYGKSIKIPTNESIRLKGWIMNYWHLQYAPEVEYGGPMKEIRERPEKQKKKGKSFISIKPIE